MQNLFKAETMRLSLPPQLLTTQQAAKQIKEYVDNYALSLLTPKFHDNDIKAKIKAKFGPKSQPWQLSIVGNITHNKKDVFIFSSTNTKKSLTYKSISEIIRGIFLENFLTIAFIDDQMQWLCQIDIFIVSLISIIVANNPNIS